MNQAERTTNHDVIRSPSSVGDVPSMALKSRAGTGRGGVFRNDLRTRNENLAALSRASLFQVSGAKNFMLSGGLIRRGAIGRGER